jgi:hydrogenase maturation factor HypF (carbamoyltransferase family)
MKSGNYLCKLCENEFEPTRRGIQKFCCSKCRKKYSYHKNKTSKSITPKLKSRELVSIKDKKTKVEEISISGIANAASGALIVHLLNKLLTKFENKSATKGDIQEIKELINQRFF